MSGTLLKGDQLMSPKIKDYNLSKLLEASPNNRNKKVHYFLKTHSFRKPESPRVL